MEGTRKLHYYDLKNWLRQLATSCPQIRDENGEIFMEESLGIMVLEDFVCRIDKGEKISVLEVAQALPLYFGNKTFVYWSMTKARLAFKLCSKGIHPPEVIPSKVQ